MLGACKIRVFVVAVKGIPESGNSGKKGNFREKRNFGNFGKKSGILCFSERVVFSRFDHYFSCPLDIIRQENPHFSKIIFFMSTQIPILELFCDNPSFPLSFKGIGNFSGILVESGISGIFREGIFRFQEGIPFVAI